ncbi:MAG: hypothetical protein FWE74_07605 [Oscillospiraceae bacterium]|nr:hypothetical protein [Oscillospiraceae bacterium]
MLTKEQIKTLCKDENFVKDFIRYDEIRKQAKRLIEAIHTIEELKPKNQTDLKPVQEYHERLRKIESAHEHLLEDVYGVTWHRHEDVMKNLEVEK